MAAAFATQKATLAEHIWYILHAYTYMVEAKAAIFVQGSNGSIRENITHTPHHDPCQSHSIPFPRPHVPASILKHLSSRPSLPRSTSCCYLPTAVTYTHNARITDRYLPRLSATGLSLASSNTKKVKKKTVNDNACNPIHVNAIRWGVIDTENLKSLLGRCAE